MDLRFPDFQFPDFQISRNLAWAQLGPTLGPAWAQPWARAWAWLGPLGWALGGPLGCNSHMYHEVDVKGHNDQASYGI